MWKAKQPPPAGHRRNTSDGHKKKSITLLLVENWNMHNSRKTKFNWAADHTETCLWKKKKLLFSALSSWHAHRVYIAVVGCTSKLKYSQLFSETWCCSARQCHSWRRRFLHAAPRRSTSRREKVDGIDKMFCSICERAAEEAGTGSVNVDFIYVYLKHVWKFFILPNNRSVNRENLQLFW